jgi:hypothetical protein
MTSETEWVRKERFRYSKNIQKTQVVNKGSDWNDVTRRREEGWGGLREENFPGLLHQETAKASESLTIPGMREARRKHVVKMIFFWIQRVFSANSACEQDNLIGIDWILFNSEDRLEVEIEVRLRHD